VDRRHLQLRLARSRQPLLLIRSLALAAALVASAASVAWDRSEIESLADRIAREHGLERKEPIQLTVLERTKLRTRLVDLVASTYTPEEIVDEGRLLVRLGLLPAGTSYEEVVLGLLEEQVMGLYDPSSKELLLLEGGWDPLAETVLVHELTHAVQDMNFDLSSLTEREPGMADRNAALEAVAEGDALLMEQVLSGLLLPGSITAEQLEMLMQLMPDQGTAMAKTPAFLREVLLFPYLHGFVLVRSAHHSGGFDAVNDLFEHPPASTEQVLHPERVGIDPPVELALSIPGEMAGLYRIAVEDVMGEFGMRAWLEQWILEPVAEEGARGWGGDRYLFLWPSSGEVGEGHLGHGVLVLMTTWDPGPAGDPESEARQFEACLEQYLAARYPDAERRDSAQRIVARIEGSQLLVVERRGLEVLFVEGLPLVEEPGAILDSLWNTGSAQ
jgi:hypothetical protein